jgi:thiol:disulfide interchange protein DsbD
VLALLAGSTTALAQAPARSPIPPAQTATQPATQPARSGIAALLDSARQKNRSGEPLTADEAFQVRATANGGDRVRIDWTIADGYYLYRSRIKVKTDLPIAQASLGALQLPEGETHTDEYFGPQQIYHRQLTASLPVARPGQAALQLPLAVTYQGCAHVGLCYPPITKVINIALPAGTPARATPIAGARTTPAAGTGTLAVSPAAGTATPAAPTTTATAQRPTP